MQVVKILRRTLRGSAPVISHPEFSRQYDRCHQRSCQLLARAKARTAISTRASDGSLTKPTHEMAELPAHPKVKARAESNDTLTAFLGYS